MTEPSSVLLDLTRRAGHYQSLHARAVEREKIWKQNVEALQQLASQQQARTKALLLENETLRARQTWLEQQRFGRKTEQREPVDSRPMDKNESERRLRNPVIGRKNCCSVP